MCEKESTENALSVDLLNVRIDEEDIPIYVDEEREFIICPYHMQDILEECIKEKGIKGMLNDHEGKPEGDVNV